MNAPPLSAPFHSVTLSKVYSVYYNHESENQFADNQMLLVMRCGSASFIIGVIMIRYKHYGQFCSSSMHHQFTIILCLWKCVYDLCQSAATVLCLCICI